MTLEKSRLAGIQIFSDWPQYEQKGFGIDNPELNGEYALARSLIKSGDTVIDIGAASGAWSSNVFNQTSDVRLIAVEPHREHFALLENRLKPWPVTLIHGAISDQAGEREFSRVRGGEGCSELSSFYRRPQVEQRLNLSVESALIKTLTLTGLCQEHKITHINFLKIDVEGAENEVISGAIELLKDQQIDFMQFEYGGAYQDAGKTLQYICALLSTFKYSLFRITNDGVIHIQRWRNELENYKHSNYLAVSSNQAGGWLPIFCKDSSQTPPVTAIGSTVGIIFSKNRAMQLDACLHSMELHALNLSRVDLCVLYLTTTEEHERQYRELAAKYTQVKFVKETNFRSNVLTLLDGHEYVLWLVDDTLWILDFDPETAVKQLRGDDTSLGFSLRLGRNTKYCYTQDREQALPSFEDMDNGLLRFAWQSAELDFGYPLELSSSIYRVSDLQSILSNHKFNNPNSLEGLLASTLPAFVSNRPHLLCPTTSIAFSAPLNLVQEQCRNRTSGHAKYSVEQLAAEFAQGKGIDVRAFSGMVPRACHQEVELVLIPRNERDSRDVANSSSVPPLITVVVTCHNYAQFLSDSVSSVLQQSFRDCELIIVNDGSSDASGAVAEKLRKDNSEVSIQVIHQADSGHPGLARNRGIQSARGKYVLCLDADDAIEPTMLQECVGLLEENPGISIAYTDRVDFGSRIGVFRAEEYNFSRLRYSNHINTCCLFRKAMWEAVGGYKTKLYEDWALWVAGGAKGFVAKRIPLPLFKYRRHNTSLSTRTEARQQRYAANVILSNTHCYPAQDAKLAQYIMDHGNAPGEIPVPWQVPGKMSYVNAVVVAQDSNVFKTLEALHRHTTFSTCLTVIDQSRNSECKTKLEAMTAAGQIGHLVEAVTDMDQDQVFMKGIKCEPADFHLWIPSGFFPVRDHWQQPLLHTLTQIPNCGATFFKFGESNTGSSSELMFRKQESLTLTNSCVLIHESSLPEEAKIPVGELSLSEHIHSRRLIFGVEGGYYFKPNHASEPTSAPLISFCIITNSGLPQNTHRQAYLDRLLASIRLSGLDSTAYEIVIVGAVGRAIDNTSIVENWDWASTGQVCKLRNLAIRSAKGQIIVHCDDDILLTPGYGSALKEALAEPWDVLCTRLLNPNGTRYWDWAAYYPEKGQTLLPYEVQDPYVYATGGHAIYRRSVFEKVQWNEGFSHGQNEEFDFAAQARAAGLKFAFNPKPLVFLQYPHCDALATVSGVAALNPGNFDSEFQSTLKTLTPLIPERKVDPLLDRIHHKLKFPVEISGKPEVKNGHTAKISVLVACHRFLQRFKVFVRSLCQQDFPLNDLEVIVANPDSPDGLSAYLATLARAYNDGPTIKEVRVDPKYYRNRGYLIQRAFEASVGQIVIGMDCDLYLPPNFIRTVGEVSQCEPQKVVGVYRNFLKPETTDKILAGIIDPKSTYTDLIHEDEQEVKGFRGVLGYCQATVRENWAKVGYPEEYDNIAQSDVVFTERLQGVGVTPLFLPDLRVLHLHHPRNWEGTSDFL